MSNKPKALSESARHSIQSGSPLVEKHLDWLARMVKVDSRSFSVNEFPGDVTEPTDMKEILKLAQEYLESIGFPYIHINRPPPSDQRSTPIMMAEMIAGEGKPTVLMYAHLDKQPYMDDERFEKWGGVPPTELHWNKDRSRAYGRGSADDLSGVVAIGMAVDAVCRELGIEPGNASAEDFARLPCNIKIIYETEEESGSATLIEQILQNREFFAPSDCVIITDVINPDTGVPGLTTSLRGILQGYVTLHPEGNFKGMDAQTALYKLLARLIHEDHSLAVEGIAKNDVPVTESERKGYELVPTSLEVLRDAAGLLPATRWTVPATKEDVIQNQLRRSYANTRPGHRVAGGVVLGAAGARIQMDVRPDADLESLRVHIEKAWQEKNPFQLKIEVRCLENSVGTFDLLIQSATKDPHSGVVGGPVPVPELQLARWIDTLIDTQGEVQLPEIKSFLADPPEPVILSSLFVENDLSCKPFDEDAARAIVEIRLAPGNHELDASKSLENHLRTHLPAGFKMEWEMEKGGDPWMTGIERPAFSKIMEALEIGFHQKPCLYGCGGSIPFVAKLMTALGNIAPLCVGAYDSHCQMHEPGESLSMADLLGCSRAIVHFLCLAENSLKIN